MIEPVGLTISDLELSNNNYQMLRAMPRVNLWWMEKDLTHQVHIWLMMKGLWEHKVLTLVKGSLLLEIDWAMIHQCLSFHQRLLLITTYHNRLIHYQELLSKTQVVFNQSKKSQAQLIIQRSTIQMMRDNWQEVVLVTIVWVSHLKTNTTLITTVMMVFIQTILKHKTTSTMKLYKLTRTAIFS